MLQGSQEEGLEESTYLEGIWIQGQKNIQGSCTVLAQKRQGSQRNQKEKGKIRTRN